MLNCGRTCMWSLDIDLTKWFIFCVEFKFQHCHFPPVIRSWPLIFMHNNRKKGNKLLCPCKCCARYVLEYLTYALLHLFHVQLCFFLFLLNHLRCITSSGVIKMLLSLPSALSILEILQELDAGYLGDNMSFHSFR